MTLGWLILIIVFFFAVFALFSPTVGSAESEESRKRREHIEEIRKMFLSQNGDFPDLILTRAFTEGSKNKPWILSAQKATSGRIRTVGIGYSNMQIAQGCGIPYNIIFLGENNPHCFYINYANDLGYTSIGSYQGVPARDVLRWITEDIREKFQTLHPEMKVGEAAFHVDENSAFSYYYFTYEVPAIQLSGWK